MALDLAMLALIELMKSNIIILLGVVLVVSFTALKFVGFVTRMVATGIVCALIPVLALIAGMTMSVNVVAYAMLGGMGFYAIYSTFSGIARVTKHVQPKRNQKKSHQQKHDKHNE